MATLLDLSDVGISIGGLDDNPRTSSGYAYLPDNSDPLFGDDAIAVAKLHPTLINNRFWSDLNTEPTSPAHPKIRHHADLAWFHLKNLKPLLDATDVKLIVPSSYDEENLKLLAGVCQSLELNVTAFIDRAVASCINYIGDTKTLVHVDLQQHQTLLTFLEAENGELKIIKKDKIPAAGLVRLQDRWLHILRQRYISGSRFDPMHSGDTEQQLFSQLNELVTHTGKDTFEFTITLDDQNLHESFSKEELAPPYKDLLGEIRDKTGELPLILDNVFSGIPNVQTGDGITIATLDAPFMGAQKMLNENTGASDGITFLSSAKIGNLGDAPADTDDDHSKTEAGTAFATHILLCGYAYPNNHYSIELEEPTLQLRLVTDKDPSRAHIRSRDNCLELGALGSELKLNQTAGSEGTKLRPGDVISFGTSNELLTAIALKESGK